jgi:hypothetical protein
VAKNRQGPRQGALNGYLYSKEAGEAGRNAWLLTNDESLEGVEESAIQAGHAQAAKLYGLAEEAAVAAGLHGRAYDMRDLKDRHQALYNLHKFCMDHPGKGLESSVYDAALRAERAMNRLYGKEA